MIKTFFSFGILSVLFLVTPQLQAQTVVADWTFNQATPDDSVGGHNFQTAYAGSATTYGSSSIGGPSTNPTFFNGGGYYGVAAGTTIFPTTDYTLSLYTEVPTEDLTNNGFLFSTNGGESQNVQIALYDGDFVAYYENNGDNFNVDGSEAVLIGSFVATSADTQLSVTDIDGNYTFTDNGVNSTSVAAGVTSFDNPHVGIAPGGGGPNFTGYMSDITVTAGVDSLPTVPEPSTYLMIGFGFLGLVLFRRSRRVNA